MIFGYLDDRNVLLIMIALKIVL